MSSIHISEYNYTSVLEEISRASVTSHTERAVGASALMSEGPNNVGPVQQPTLRFSKKLKQFFYSLTLVICLVQFQETIFLESHAKKKTSLFSLTVSTRHCLALIFLT